jgi:Polyketide cyclase / dehydrase and lipid transport
VRTELGLTLAATEDRVWAVLEDWRRYPEWMPDVAWVRLRGDKEGLGMRLAVRTKVLGVPLVTDELVITAWEPPWRMAIEHCGLVRGVGEWRLEAIGGGTRFTWTEDLRMPPPVLGGIALFAYSPVLRHNFRQSLHKLARRVGSPS